MIAGMTYWSSRGDYLTMPTYFDYTTVGGNDSRTFKVTIYDSMGQQHLLTGTFVKTDAANTWDLIINSVLGERAGDWDTYDIYNSAGLNRRIGGIEFNVDGSLGGLNSLDEQAEFSVQFADDPSVTQTISLDLGTPGEFNGLTQFSSQYSSAGAMTQDGYEAGSLYNFSVDHRGVVIGTFTNGVKIDIAQIATAVFPNPQYLSVIDHDCYEENSFSGQAEIGPVNGVIHGKSLEERIEMIILTGTPMIVDHCAVEGGLKAVSFEDALSLRGLSWKTVYEDDPCFAQDGRWIDHRDDTVSWTSGDYRLLPHSPYIDASIASPWYPALPAVDILGNDRPVQFNVDDPGLISGLESHVGLLDQQVGIPEPVNVSGLLVTRPINVSDLPVPGQIETLVPIKISDQPNIPTPIVAQNMFKSNCDLGAYESSWRAVEATVRIYPNTIEDISLSDILSMMGGTAESAFDHTWAYVIIQIPASELENAVFDAKRVGLITGDGLAPIRVFAFENRRFESVCVTAIYNYGEFVQSIRNSYDGASLHFHDLDIDVNRPLDFWIDGVGDSYLKTNGSVRYKRPRGGVSL